MLKINKVYRLDTYTSYYRKLQGITGGEKRILLSLAGRSGGKWNVEEVGERLKLVYTMGGDVYDGRLFARNSTRYRVQCNIYF